MIPVTPRVFFSLTLLLLSLPAAALEPDYECVRGFGGRLERLSLLAAEARRENAARLEAQTQARSARIQMDAGPGKIHAARTAMQSSVGVGARIDDFLTKRPNISVEFDAIPGISSHDEIGGSVPLVTLRINKDLPRTNKILAIAIAHGAFDLMYADFPESTQKAYMKASVVSRAWLEVFGDASKLPVLDADVPEYRNAEMEALLRSWIGKDAGTSQREIAARLKTVDFQQLLSDNEDEIHRLQRFADEDRDHEHRTHHPAPDIQPQVKRYYEALETQKRLLKAEQAWKNFRMGVEYKNIDGDIDSDDSGEELWKVTNQHLLKR